MIVLCGKTASGKDTIQKQLILRGMKSIVSYTTRPPRQGEVDGVAYHFISQEEFLKKRESNFFAESTSYNVASGETWYYGSAVEDLTDDKVVILNPEGVKEIKKITTLNPKVFYIIADEDTIWNRLRSRGDNSEEARRRLNADDEDFKGINKYIDFAIRNEGLISPEEIAEMILYLYERTKKDEDKISVCV